MTQDDAQNPSTPRKGTSSGANTDTGAGAEATHGTGAAPGDPDATGEPRDREHVSGYGGHGGAPKTSANEREPKSPE